MDDLVTKFGNVLVSNLGNTGQLVSMLGNDLSQQLATQVSLFKGWQHG